MSMQLNPSEISELIKERIKDFDAGAEARTEGTVVSLTDGICRIHGLADAMQGEMLEFPNDTFGSGTEPGTGLGRRGDTWRLRAYRGRGHGQVYRPHP